MKEQGLGISAGDYPTLHPSPPPHPPSSTHSSEEVLKCQAIKRKTSLGCSLSSYCSYSSSSTPCYLQTLLVFYLPLLALFDLSYLFLFSYPPHLLCCHPQAAVFNSLSTCATPDHRTIKDFEVFCKNYSLFTSLLLNLFFVNCCVNSWFYFFHKSARKNYEGNVILFFSLQQLKVVFFLLCSSHTCP